MHSLLRGRKKFSPRHFNNVVNAVCTSCTLIFQVRTARLNSNRTTSILHFTASGYFAEVFMLCRVWPRQYLAIKGDLLAGQLRNWQKTVWHIPIQCAPVGKCSSVAEFQSGRGGASEKHEIAVCSVRKHAMQSNDLIYTIYFRSKIH